MRSTLGKIRRVENMAQGNAIDIAGVHTETYDAPRALDDQELLYHEQAVGDDGLRATRSEEFGDCCQNLEEECQQTLHGSAG